MAQQKQRHSPLIGILRQAEGPVLIHHQGIICGVAFVVPRRGVLVYLARRSSTPCIRAFLVIREPA
jgi:hypothetical protein